MWTGSGNGDGVGGWVGKTEQNDSFVSGKEKEGREETAVFEDNRFPETAVVRILETRQIVYLVLPVR